MLGEGGPLPSGDRRPVHEIVAELARTDPTAAAVRGGDVELSYVELDAVARRVAADLTACGVSPGDRVAVLAEPSAAAIAGVLGILQCGGAYVPLDAAQPPVRLAETLADARVTAAVVAGEVGDGLSKVGLPVVQVAPRSGPATDFPHVAVSPADTAYLIYTSGTTGEPKGVPVEHAQLSASTLARRLVYPDASVFLLLSPLAFDSSVAGLWGTLTSGGCLVVATAEELRDPGRLVDLVDRHAVTSFLCVPALYGSILDAAESHGAERLACLRTVIVAGEELSQALLERHFALLPGTSLVNEYGPTEATVWASYHLFTAPCPVTIGRPIPGAKLYVLDEQRRPVPRGQEGELYIGGAGVTRGYFGRPEDTRRSFFPDPFYDAEGARMYRTGDLVRWNDSGLLEFLGRRDDQVKIRGHRVELGAVAARLRGISGVKDAVVLPDDGGGRLIAFVAVVSGRTPATLRREAAELMSPAMVPSRIHLVESIPLTVNGKVDRARLRQLANQNGAGAITPPVADGLTTQVAGAWSEVLKLTEVPIDVNFFELGGHSLAIFQLQEALQRRVGVRPPMVQLFEHSTVAAQVAMIRASGAVPTGGR